MRITYSPVKENGIGRICTNQSSSICIESQILSHKLGKDIYDWLGYVERMPEERTVKKALKNIPDGKKSVAKP